MNFYYPKVSHLVALRFTLRLRYIIIIYINFNCSEGQYLYMEITKKNVASFRAGLVHDMITGAFITTSQRLKTKTLLFIMWLR